MDRTPREFSTGLPKTARRALATKLGSFDLAEVSVDAPVVNDAEVPLEIRRLHADSSRRGLQASRQASRQAKLEKIRATYCQKNSAPALPLLNSSYAEGLLLEDKLAAPGPSRRHLQTAQSRDTPRNVRSPGRPKPRISELPPLPKWLRKKMAQVSKEMTRSAANAGPAPELWPFAESAIEHPEHPKTSGGADRCATRHRQTARSADAANDRMRQAASAPGGSRSSRSRRNKKPQDDHIATEGPKAVPELFLDTIETEPPSAENQADSEETEQVGNSTSSLISSPCLGVQRQTTSKSVSRLSSKGSNLSATSTPEKTSQPVQRRQKSILKRPLASRLRRRFEFLLDGESKTRDAAENKPGYGNRSASLSSLGSRPRKFKRRRRHLGNSVSRLSQDSQSIWIEAFKKVRQDGEIHQDDLGRALETIGFISPDRAMIVEVVDNITKYSTLTQDDFVRFVQAFEQREHEAHAEAFAKCDEDGSGKVESQELAGLLKSFGVEPMKHVLKEVIEQVDDDGEGSLNLEEFERCLELLKTRGGFCEHEHEQFMEVFKRFDRDGLGEIKTQEFLQALSWLGYSITGATAKEIAASVDFDGSGALNEREFIQCMIRVREYEVGIVKQLFERNDADGSGTISGSEFEHVLVALGYLPEYDAVIEAAKDAGINVVGSDLDLSELWRLLTVYRAREGFCTSELNEILAAFVRFDADGSGEISTPEAGKMLRWFGYPLAYQAMQQIVARVDVDGSGQLDIAEIRKLMRMLREDDLHQVRNLFAKYDATGSGMLTKAEAKAALKELGCDISKLTAETLTTLASGGISIKDLSNIVMHSKRVERENFRNNFGFSSLEVLEIKSVFKSYDDDDSGEIANKELVRLVEDTFPDMASDKAMRPQLLATMSSVDANNNGKIDLNDFIHLMSMIRGLQEKTAFVSEKAAIEKTSFSVMEVEGFRELFLATDAGQHGLLSFQAVKEMIEAITPLGAKHSGELSAIFVDIATVVGGEMKLLDFPGFLLFMQRLLDCNFACIKDKTSKTDS